MTPSSSFFTHNKPTFGSIYTSKNFLILQNLNKKVAEDYQLIMNRDTGYAAELAKLQVILGRNGYLIMITL
jgi:hypothetical protein